MYDYTSDTRPWNDYLNRVTKLVLPSGITHIGNQAFYFTNFSGPLTIPEGVKTIGNNAFYAFHKATSVTLPASVTSIGDNAFMNVGRKASDCPFTVAEGSKLTSIGTNAFTYYGGIVDLRNCKSLTTIGEKVFYHFKKTVYLPISLRTIEKNAFYNTTVSDLPTVRVAYDNSVLYINNEYKGYYTTSGTLVITSYLNLKTMSSDALSLRQILLNDIGLTWNDKDLYFEINDEQDLIDLGNYVIANRANTCEGLTFKMTADLNFSEISQTAVNNRYGKGNFMPIGIGVFSNRFLGHFDGQGHTITGLYFYSTTNSVGLFGDVNSPAVVENVILIGPELTSSTVVGGIVGWLTD